MNIISIFLKELKTFMKENYYIFIIAIVSFIPLLLTGGNTSLLEISGIFGLHLLADIFMAMMMFELGRGNKKEGYVYQLIGSILFLIIGIISGILHNNWVYLIPNLIYTPVTLNNLSIAFKNKNYKIINFRNILCFAIMIYILMFVFGLISGIAQIIQLFGILGFAVILNIKDYHKMRKYGIFILSMIILGGLVKINNEFFVDHLVNGATFSYTILPLVVLISFVKNK